MKIKRFLYKLIPPCLKCPYTLGLVKTIINPCPMCRLSGYRMFERFPKMSENTAGERKGI